MTQDYLGLLVQREVGDSRDNPQGGNPVLSPASLQQGSGCGWSSVTSAVTSSPGGGLDKGWEQKHKELMVSQAIEV